MSDRGKPGERWAAEMRRVLAESEASVSRAVLGHALPPDETRGTVTVFECGRAPPRRPRETRVVLAGFAEKWTVLGWVARGPAVDGKVTIDWFSDMKPPWPPRNK